MADRFPTRVNIGGPVTIEQLKEIVSEASGCGLGHEWERCYSETILWEKTMRIIDEAKGRMSELEFSDHEVAYEGEGPLADRLIKMGIPFNVDTGARYEYGATMSWWRPGMGDKDSWEHWDGDGGGSITISLHALKEWKKRKKGLTDVIKFLEKIPPDLPEFVLTDWVSPSKPPEPDDVKPKDGGNETAPTTGGASNSVDTP